MHERVIWISRNATLVVAIFRYTGDRIVNRVKIGDRSAASVAPVASNTGLLLLHLSL